jgi:hypothetical protein
VVSGRGGKSGKGNETFRIEISPSPAAIEKEFGHLGAEFTNWRPAFEAAVPDVIAGARGILASRGGALGQSWRPVTAAYARRKARGTTGKAGVSSRGRVLDMWLSGRLRHQLSSRAGVLRITKRALVFGTTLPYARAAQYGQGRRVLGWTEDMKRRVTEHLGARGRYLTELAAQRMSSRRAA